MNNCITKCQNIGSKVMDAANRKVLALMLFLQTTLMTVAPTLCVTIKSNIDMDSLFGSMADIIIKIAFYVGALIAISGIFSLVIAYKDDNADGQSRAIRLIVVGVCLIGFKTILSLAGII